MSSISPPPAPPAHPDEVSALKALFYAVRTRVISGLLLALPIVLTFWIVYWLYTTVTQAILDPLAVGIAGLFHSPWAQTFWWRRFVNPLIAAGLVVAVLYGLGLLARSWISRAIDWVLNHVPLVTPIYKALSNVFRSLGNQFQGQRNQRVVLVEFPHPGCRALAFVTNTLRDVRTDKTILTVCVLTGVFPPAGFTLFVPEESVSDVDWSVNQSLQVILSGGITTPATIRFFEPPGPVSASASGATRVAGGPIMDAHGHPIETHLEPPADVVQG